MGRHKKPIAEHKRDGTFQPCRHDGPEPDVESPQMPPELSGNAQSLWHRIIPHLITMKVLAKADQLTLQLMCESYATYIDACDEIEKDGAFIEQVNKAGETYKTEHPACKARSRAWKEIIYLCRQFGMTPSSRTGLNVPSKESGKADPFEALLKGNAN